MSNLKGPNTGGWYAMMSNGQWIGPFRNQTEAAPYCTPGSSPKQTTNGRPPSPHEPPPTTNGRIRGN